MTGAHLTLMTEYLNHTDGPVVVQMTKAVVNAAVERDEVLMKSGLCQVKDCGSRRWTAFLSAEVNIEQEVNVCFGSFSNEIVNSFVTK